MGSLQSGGTISLGGTWRRRRAQGQRDFEGAEVGSEAGREDEEGGGEEAETGGGREKGRERQGERERARERGSKIETEGE